MRLSELARTVGGEIVGGDIEIRGLSRDSRRVQPGDLFVAIPGTRQDGRTFIADAMERGAAAVCADASVDAGMTLDRGVPLLRVADPRAALAALAAGVHGEPARAMQLVGVTGTLGKTSVTQLLAAALAASANGRRRRGISVGVVGSLGVTVHGPAAQGVAGQLPETDGMTTPDPLTLHRALRVMADAGVETVAMEVTSHALAQERVGGIRFDLGIVTNLIPDEHLEFHRTPDAYMRTKARFFDHLAPAAPVIVVAEDAMVRAWAAAATSHAAHPLVTVSVGAVVRRWDDLPVAESSACVEGLRWDGGGAAFTLRVTRRLPRVRPAARDGEEWVEPCAIPVVLPVLGVQQVTNAAIAATAALMTGADASGVTEGFAAQEPIRRRMEIVRSEGPIVVDDTSGNPATLRAVFASVHVLPHHGLRIVFGLRGMRGPEINRRLAARLASLVARCADQGPVTLVVTGSDDVADARNRVTAEEYAAAIDALDAAAVPYVIERRLDAAIDRMLAAAGKRDLVLLLGAQGMDSAAGMVRDRLAVMHRPR